MYVRDRKRESEKERQRIKFEFLKNYSDYIAATSLVKSKNTCREMFRQQLLQKRGDGFC